MAKSTSIQFSRFERNGLIFLAFMIIVSAVSKKYITTYFTKNEKFTQNDSTKLALLEKQILEAKNVYSTSSYNNQDKIYNNQDKIYSTNNTSNNYPKFDKYDFKIEINSATSADFEKLYGIGKVYAERIVKFRDKLGGFYSIHQIKDVFGIEDSVYQKFKKNLTIKPVNPTKININSATFEELTANPYFFSTVAKQIIGYRTKVKPFASVEDVKNLYFVRDHPEHFDKMLPYIKLE
ncbi:MAG: helix-hairpin-helix domain-containing protein [Chitinophagales bacterium]|nr:helix-hairpin-helix domain-containing protein [Bacteroidota bacterium]